MSQYVMSIDQGTTGSTVLILDQALNVKAKQNVEFPQIYPKPGWVEHNPEDIWQSVLKAMSLAFKESGISASDLAAIGITNQRETAVLWEGKEAKPLHNAIVWQCRRTADICQKIKDDGHEKTIRQKTGLVVDAYFSGTKITWMMDHVKGLREKAQRGDVYFGTVDSFLVFKLTAGAAHVTDVSNASRTMLMDLKTLAWDDTLLDILQVPKNILPQIMPSSYVYGQTKNVPGLPDGIPIAGIAGDQQAALFGQACFEPGQAKCTYGTGSFLLINTGSKPIFSDQGILTTVGWKIGDKVSYALEGSVFIAGAAVQWLRDGLQLIQSSAEIEELAQSVEDSGGIYFVPALAGLGAPYWNPNARGIITGLTRATTRAHLARATLEGIAFQIADLIGQMERDYGQKISDLRIDGGACANNLLMQFQADITQRTLRRPTVIETTALGSAFLAGLATNFWQSPASIQETWKEDRTFTSQMNETTRQERLKAWKQAVAKA